MKTIPRTKHSNKYNQEKNRLVSKALFEKKLDAMKGYVEEYLKSNPIDIKCKDIQDEVKYTVFVSVSDGKKRARVCHASAADFEASFMKVREKVRTVIDKYSLTPVWIKIDVVDFVQKVPFATVYKGNIIKNLIMDCQSYTKYRPNETTGGIFVSWRRKEELPTGA